MKDGFKWLYFDKTYIEPPVVVPFIRGYLCQNDFYSSRCLFKVYTKYVNTTAASIGILDEST